MSGNFFLSNLLEVAIFALVLKVLLNCLVGAA